LTLLGWQIAKFHQELVHPPGGFAEPGPAVEEAVGLPLGDLEFGSRACFFGCRDVVFAVFEKPIFPPLSEWTAMQAASIKPRQRVVVSVAGGEFAN
jgi:hypothetical protein